MKLIQFSRETPVGVVFLFLPTSIILWWISGPGVCIIGSLYPCPVCLHWFLSFVVGEMAYE